ncbi:MAG: aldo/keto reductase, partial [Methanomicrobiales archaeon]|nr:aldo/keto reductase [Methanomicrobiales archaeon]
VEAKEQGLVTAIGVTGHYDPAILIHAIETWPLDTVLLPVNPVEGVIGGFLESALPAARRRGLGIIGMKVFGGGQYIDPAAGISPEQLLRYALSQDIDVAIAGCRTPQEVRTLAAAGRLPILPQREQRELLDMLQDDADRLAYYRGVI